jgi:hypothetical protein
MPRPSFLKDRIKVSVSMEEALKVASTKRAEQHYGFQGGLSELIARLLIADQKSARGLAKNAPRTFRKTSKTARAASS